MKVALIAVAGAAGALSRYGLAAAALAYAALSLAGGLAAAAAGYASARSLA